MAESKLKTFAFILYGVLTFLLLCAVLVLIFKEDKSCNSPSLDGVTRMNPAEDLEQNGSEMSPKVEIPAPAAGEAPTAPAMPKFPFQGRYELYDSQNFDEFLSELGIGYFKRLAATRASSEYQITKSGNKWSLKTISTFGESLIEFENGVPFKEDRLDGNTVKSVINIVGTVWKQTQESDPPVTIDREFFADKIKVTSTVNGVTSIRLYKRL